MRWHHDGGMAPIRHDRQLSDSLCIEHGAAPANRHRQHTTGAAAAAAAAESADGVAVLAFHSKSVVSLILITA